MDRLYTIINTSAGRPTLDLLATFRDPNDAVVYGKRFAYDKKVDVLHITPGAENKPVIYSHKP